MAVRRARGALVPMGRRTSSSKRSDAPGIGVELRRTAPADQPTMRTACARDALLPLGGAGLVHGSGPAASTATVTGMSRTSNS